ncbi:MAG: hypothetical protein AB4426_27550 [Xenococcaceae cyanobacterium]
MKAIRGIVSSLERHHVPSAVSFELNRQPVVFICAKGEVPIISNGNEVIVAGRIQRGVFRARAYLNLTKKTWDENFIKELNYLGVAFSLAFAFLILFLLTFFSGIYNKIIWVSFLILSIVSFLITIALFLNYRKYKKSARKAIKSLK